VPAPDNDPWCWPCGGLTYRATVDVPARFRKSKAVGAAFGLTCSKYQSGEIDRSGRISRCGDEMMRVMLLRLAFPLRAKGLCFSWLGHGRFLLRAASSVAREGAVLHARPRRLRMSKEALASALTRSGLFFYAHRIPQKPARLYLDHFSPGFAFRPRATSLRMASARVGRSACRRRHPSIWLARSGCSLTSTGSPAPFGLERDFAISRVDLVMAS
jgi:Transposase IS116/IS110/IS902 family